MNRPWLVHYDPDVPTHLDYPELTLPQLLAQAASRYPDRTATVFRGARVRYRTLARRVEAFASALQSLGVRRGDRVAVMLPNLPQFPVAFYGTLAAGAVVVPTNPLYTQHELEHQLADAGATVVVTLDQLFGRLQGALPSTQVRAVIVTDIAAALPPHLRPLFALKMRKQGLRRVRTGGVVYRMEDLVGDRLEPERLLRRARGVDASQPMKFGPDDLAVLQYTGGTTGTSKGAMLTHRNLVANAVQVHAWQGEVSGEEPRILCVAPFFHVYGLTVGMNLAVVSGATMVLVPRFIPKDVAKAAQKYRPQFFPGVPTMYVALAGLPGFSERQFGSLRVCISGAAPLPPDVQRTFQEVSKTKIIEGYGLTEASPVTHCNPVHGGGRPGTIGVPFPDTDASVTDPDTWEPLPAGAVGELTVRGPQVMQGYWNRPDETAAVLRDGWLHTGDMAVADDDGFFRIVDRKKDMVIAGGYNVYPREVEDVLYSHPMVNQAAVVGVPSDYRGETVKAVIVPREGVQLTAEEIVEFCRRELAAYKVPKIIEFRTELPMTLVGKVLRRQLREEHIRAHPQPAAEERPVA